MSLGLRTAERLANKIVFITGASAGIGRATALEYAAASNGQIRLVLVARRLAKLEQLKDELKSKYADMRVHISKLDVCETATIEPYLESLPAEYKNIDILINNAGKALGRAPVGEIKSEDIDEMFDTNVKALVHLTQAVVKGFKERNSGDIVQLGSIAGRDTYPGGSIYCASKFAVKAFTSALRKELIDTNIRVIEVAPGAVETEFSVVRNYGDESAAKNVYAGRTPLTAEDIAEIIVFATSRKDNTVLSEVVVFPTDQAGSTSVFRKS